MSTLWVMVGLQGAGKSTVAKDYCERFSHFRECEIVCLDTIRKQMYGSEEIQGDGFEVWKRGKEDVERLLSEGKDVIYDATNLTKKYRKWCLSTEAKHIAIFVNTPLEECIKRNEARERKVPQDVIINAHKKLQPPTMEEGFNAVIEIT